MKLKFHRQKSNLLDKKLIKYFFTDKMMYSTFCGNIEEEDWMISSFHDKKNEAILVYDRKEKFPIAFALIRIIENIPLKVDRTKFGNFYDIFEETKAIEIVLFCSKSKGKGVGTKLIKYIEGLENDSSINYIVVEAEKTAANFYLKNGYEELDESDFNDSTVYMRKKLPEKQGKIEKLKEFCGKQKNKLSCKSQIHPEGGKHIRKHIGIIQSGGNQGKLKKGYKYTGQRTKTGMAVIKKQN